MATNVYMPRLGESVVEGTVSQWLVQEGDAIAKFAPLLEVSTDKVDTEVPSPAQGVLLNIYISAGETVAAGALLATIGQPGEQGELIGESANKISDVTLADTCVDAHSGDDAVPAVSQTAASDPDLGFISPAVRKLVDEHDIDLSQVSGSGLKGRVRKRDVIAYLQARDTAAGRDTTPIPQLDPAGGLRPQILSSTPLQTAAEIIPQSRIRHLIAEHMVQSKRMSAHVTTVFDCDLTAVIQHRYANKARFEQQGLQLTFTPYFVAAVAATLKQHPYANSSWSDDGILLHRDIHVGVAVALDDGLVVPVIKHADSLDLAALAQRVNDLGQRARSGNLAPDEIQGGTFTITNHGTAGSLFSTPIINQPQAGILGIGRIHKQVVVLNPGHPLLPDAADSIAIRSMAYLSFSFDHRLLDGAIADAFVASVKHRLESGPS
ncbi:MAG: 2-oxo acid dehydrogenase subunit E2 [Chloroflexi bacterium]|nr:2-oxo acid dehydrogenase subunit E2 [Chloroflexota bacterium]